MRKTKIDEEDETEVTSEDGERRELLCLKPDLYYNSRKEVFMIIM